jgi:hypothetical protein
LHFRTAPATTVFVQSGERNNVLKDHSWPILDGDLILVGDHKRNAAPSVAIFDGWEFMSPARPLP